MKIAIAAVLYHCCDSETVEKRHQFCPISSESWYKYRKDMYNGTSFYKHKPGIPQKFDKYSSQRLWL